MASAATSNAPPARVSVSLSAGRRSLLDLLLPPTCVACGGAIDHAMNALPMCPPCQERFAPLTGDVCRRCSAPISPIEVGRENCPHCRGSRFRFDGVTALGVYVGPMREAVLRIKHRHGELLALALGQLLAERAAATRLDFDLIVPMPMHWRRRLVRGVNNPELLAERVARRLGAPTDRRVLRFRRNIKQQSTLAPTLRRVNVRRALAIAPGYDLAGSRILLVDDILTTGATANAAARVLKQSKVAAVHVAVVARGIGFD